MAAWLNRNSRWSFGLNLDKQKTQLAEVEEETMRDKGYDSDGEDEYDSEDVRVHYGWDCGGDEIDV